MDANQIIPELSVFIAHKILKQPSYKLEPQTRLLSSGLVDSFHLVDLALFIEDHFGAHIDDTELNVDHFDTLEQLADLVAKRV